jgi:hypothetical protein
MDPWYFVPPWIEIGCSKYTGPNNAKSATVLECFLSGVSKFGLPHRVTSDKGLENTAVADFIISARGPGKVHLHYHESLRYRSFLNLILIYELDFEFVQKPTVLVVKSERFSFRVVPSIERMWRDVLQGVLCIYYNLFQFMVEQNIMDPLNDSHVAVLQYTFSWQINEKRQIENILRQ